MVGWTRRVCRKVRSKCSSSNSMLCGVRFRIALPCFQKGRDHSRTGGQLCSHASPTTMLCCFDGALNDRLIVPKARTSQGLPTYKQASVRRGLDKWSQSKHRYRECHSHQPCHPSQILAPFVLGVRESHSPPLNARSLACARNLRRRVPANGDEALELASHPRQRT